MNRLRRQSLIIVVWMTIPFVIASGMPRVGCLCLNGDHRPFCHGIQKANPIDATSRSGCSGCECCLEIASESSTPVATVRTCCGKSAVPSAPGVAATDRCCQPYLILPTIVKSNAVAQASAGETDSDWVPSPSAHLNRGSILAAVVSPRSPPVSPGVDILQRCCVLVI